MNDHGRSLEILDRWRVAYSSLEHTQTVTLPSGLCREDELEDECCHLRPWVVVGGTRTLLSTLLVVRSI